MVRFWPLGTGRTVTSDFGPRWGAMHWGVDFGRPGGSGGMPVYAVQTGAVVMAGPAQGFGSWVVLDHPDTAGGGTTVYGHIVPEVRVGQAVAAGARIAHINPDSATNGGVAPHLHLEWHRSVWTPPGPDRLNPLDLLSGAAEPENPTPTSGGEAMGDQLQADITILSPSDSGPRDPHRCSLIIVHTNQGPEMGSLEGLLGYMADPARQVSYNLVVGGDGRIGRSNDDNYVPWSAGSPANECGLHVCVLGYAEQSREEWLDNPAQLHGLARVIRDWSDRYDIPIRKLTGAQMRAGESGVGGHDTTVDAWHSTDHNDPGPDFPWDVVLDMARNLDNPPPNKEQEMTPEQARMLADVHRELTQRYPSRSKYGHPGELVDTLAGLTLNVDGRVHEASIDVPNALARIESALADLPARIAAAVKAGA